MSSRIPWRDAITDPPRLTTNVIVFYDGWIGEGFYLESSNTWLLLGGGPINVQYWMPRPELPLKKNQQEKLIY